MGFQTTTQLHFAPRRLHDSLAETEARVQAKRTLWDAEAQVNIAEAAARKKETRQVLARNIAFEKPLGGTLAQGGRVGKDPLGLRPSATYPTFESTSRASFRNWHAADPDTPEV